MQWLKLRAPEWILIGFFAYLCFLVPFFPDRVHLRDWGLPLLLLTVWAGFTALSHVEHRVPWRPWGLGISRVRDCLPVFVTLLAFRTMERFLPSAYDEGYQRAWIRWDCVVLEQWGLQHFLESAGKLVPGFLELCYLLVYGLPFYCLLILYVHWRRRSVDRFLCVYLVGTLVAYALFPFFPTKPPRLAFPDVAMPNIVTGLRQINLDILQAGTIHVGVFPSAHVSSAFAAAFGLFLVLPDKKIYGILAFLYAVCVSAAVVYGRYHYVVDVVSGFGVSLVAASTAVGIYHFSRSRNARM